MPLELNIGLGERNWLKLSVELRAQRGAGRAPAMPLNGFGIGWFQVNVATGLPVASNVGVWYCFHSEKVCSFSFQVPKFQMPYVLLCEKPISNSQPFHWCCRCSAAFQRVEPVQIRIVPGGDEAGVGQRTERIAGRRQDSAVEWIGQRIVRGDVVVGGGDQRRGHG